MNVELRAHVCVTECGIERRATLAAMVKVITTIHSRRLTKSISMKSEN